MLCGVDKAVDALSGMHLGDKRLALVTHAASLTKTFESSKSFLCRHLNITDLFAPEHGLGSFIADGKDVEDQRDEETGLVVHSLYSNGGKAVDPDVFQNLDGILFDIQDVGLRFYTYIATLKQLLELGKPVIVLDRPNPLGGSIVEGTILPPSLESFVGPGGLPVRYGLTIGELAFWMQHHYRLCGELGIVELSGYGRSSLWQQTGRPWTMTSPALSHVEAVFLYAGFCLFEGTNLSEGRGTSAPFELFGAPFIDPWKLASEVAKLGLTSVAFTPISFIPSQNKHQGELCHGLYAHILDYHTLRPFSICLKVLSAIHRLYPDQLVFNAHFSKLAGFEPEELFADKLEHTLQRSEADAQTFMNEKRRFERYGN